MTERRTPSTGPVLVRLSDSGLVLEDLTQDVRGLDVYDNDGDHIGTVERLYTDDQEGKVRFLEVSAGGVLGLGGKRFLVPVGAVGEVREDGVVVDQSRQKVAESPPFDTDVVLQPAYQREVYEYYGYPDAPGPYPGGRTGGKEARHG
jgi:sporulation protein YlmC with PRC-barrel domain